MAIFSLFIVFLMCDIVSMKTYQCDSGTIYPERGTQVVIDCVVQGNLIAVFWYRDSTDNDPFLRLENGRKTEPVGFNIQDNGAMVINNADISHDGLYVNRIVDNAGQSRDKNITIEVKVSLESEPIIVDCSSSVHESCADVEEEKRQTTLACIAGPAKPKVDISWSSYDGTQQPAVDRNYHNDSTNLYTSISLLQHNPNEYLFEYFTCDPAGEAATNETAVIFKKGNKDIVADDQNTEYVISGYDLSLSCSELAVHPMGEWGVVYPNQTFHLLWRKYPGYQAGPCNGADDCEVQTDGSLHMTKVTYIREGQYVCAYSNGVLEAIRKIPVQVLVSPVPRTTVIKGCEEKSECELKVANIGSIECSILGSRPSVKPNVIVNKTAVHMGVFLFDDERVSFAGTAPGTYDTIHKVNYEIPECSGVVLVDCIPGGSEHNEKILKSSAKLITATNKCDENRVKPGVVAVIVILFLALISAAIAVVICKRDQVRRFICAGYKKTPQDEEEEEVEGGAAQKTNPREVKKGTKLSDLIQACFDRDFQPVFDSVVKKETQPLNFEQMMTAFCEEHKVTNAVPHLLQFLRKKSSSVKEEDTMAVLKYILNNLPHGWISPFLKDLAVVIKENHISSTNYISLIGEAYRMNMIEIGQYVELTGALLEGHVISFDNIMSDLKSFVDKKYCEKEEFAGAILQYYRKGWISDEKITEEICGESLSFGFAFPFVLQSVYHQSKKKNDAKISQWFQLFTKIWTKKIGENNKIFGPLAVNCNDPKTTFEDFRNPLIKSYLFSYSHGVIDIVTAVNMIEKTETQPPELDKLLVVFVGSELWTSVETVTNLLKTCISKKLLSEQVYLTILKSILEEQKLSFEEFKNIIGESMENKWLSERLFEEGMEKEIEKGTGKKRDWIIIVTELRKKNLIGDGVQKNLFQVVIYQHKMKRDDVKAILYDTGMNSEQKNSFLDKLKFS